MTKKSAGAIFIAVIIIAIAGSLFYKNHLKQQQNNERFKSFENARSIIKKKELDYETQQKIRKAIRDSFSEIPKEEREAIMKKLKEDIKKIQKEINKQQLPK
jgi:uncharacterized protein HemX